ncbi:MAG TPA: glycosyltransferase family 1 protein [Arcobacter sp.]|nr:glycosyltransferase family 1 protein [Arcobacter sp.]
MSQKRVLAELINQLYTTNKNLLAMLGRYLVKKYNKTLVDIINDINITNQDIIEFFIEIPYEDPGFSLSLSHYLTNDPIFDDLLPPVSLDKNNAIENILISHKNYILDESNSLELRYSLFYDLLIRMFQQNQGMSQLKEPYLKLLSEIQSQTKIKEQTSSDTDRIFIFTNQYLESPTHAPSNIVRVLTQQFEKIGLKVIVVSCTPVPFPLKLEFQNMQFNQNTIQRGDVKELYENSFIIELSGNPLKENIFEDFCNGLQLNNNDTFILVGERCIQFDILPFKNKFHFPTGTSSSISTAKYLIADRDFNLYNTKGEKLELIKCPNDFTLEKDVEFSPPIKEDIEKLCKIVIVGNRLNAEIDETLWDELVKLSKKISAIKIFIVGEFDINHVPENIKEMVNCVGFQDNLKQFLVDKHFYINPKRNGGGQSSLFALKVGVPVISTNFGDVAHLMKHQNCIDSYNQITDFVVQYIEDKNFKDKIDTYNKSLLTNPEELLDGMNVMCKSILEYSGVEV